MSVVKVSKEDFEKVESLVRKHRPAREQVAGYPESIHLRAKTWDPVLRVEDWVEITLCPKLPEEEEGTGQEGQE